MAAEQPGSMLCAGSDALLCGRGRLLEQIFNFGACVFALGHICYLAAYFSEAHFSIATAVSLVVLLAGMYLIHRKQTVGKSDREILSVVAYGLVLSAMTAGAITYCLQEQSFGSMLTAFGAVGFFISDNILIWRAAKRLRKPPAGRGAAAVLLRRCLFDCGRAGSWIKITFTLRVFFCMIGYSVKAEIPLCRRHLWWKGRWQKQRQQIGSKMEFEHYIQQGQQKLRCGYTTGTCAALAGKAAVRMLLGGQKTEEISVLTPKGLWVTTAVEEIQSGDGWVSCGVRKDAGDDIDVTAQSLICVKAKKTAGTKIVIDGGIGVGRVTKPGLEQPVGAAAINSVPRRMILQEAEAECLDAGYEGGLLLTVFVPDGEALAKKTFNPQLGIQGGISILGTTGIVEPKSVQALVDTIGLEIRQRRALGEDALLLTPGNYGMEFLKDRPEFASMTPVQCSNYIGEAFDFAVSSGFSKVILVGHIGKLVKLAGGIMNTHSRVADCRCELFAAHAALAGVSRNAIGRLMEAATTDACLEILDEEGKKEAVMQSLMKKIGQHAAHRLGGTVEVTVLVFSNRFGVLGEAQCQEI